MIDTDGHAAGSVVCWACLRGLPAAIPLAMASPLIQLFLWDAGGQFASFLHAQAAAG